MELYFRMFAYGLRMLVKKPTVMIVAVLTLALGVGANTAILECFYGRGPACWRGHRCRIGLFCSHSVHDGKFALLGCAPMIRLCF